jgi:sialate O-acetylesterase
MAVQETQRRIPASIPHTAVVSAIDLELDDFIHIGTPGLKRLGRRLARVALRQLYGQTGATTPNLDQVTKGPGPTLVVKFRGVNLRADHEGEPGTPSGGASGAVGLRPARHIAGFSVRSEEGSEIPVIFDAAVTPERDRVLLKLSGAIPPGAQLWYGYGRDPYCNLTDSLDMAVPVFGPIALDAVK